MENYSSTPDEPTSPGFLMPGRGASAMASIQVAYTFADSEQIAVCVELESSYPDAVDEARKTAVHTFEEVLAASVTFLTKGESGETDDG